jgi:hypothetical protein
MSDDVVGWSTTVRTRRFQESVLHGYNHKSKRRRQAHMLRRTADLCLAAERSLMHPRSDVYGAMLSVCLCMKIADTAAVESARQQPR